VCAADLACASALLHADPVVLSVAALIRMGGVASMRKIPRARWRPRWREPSGHDQPLPIAVLQVPRQTEYGLAFYRNQIVSSYDRGEIPEGPHLLVAKEGAQSELAKVVGSRVVELIAPTRRSTSSTIGFRASPASGRCCRPVVEPVHPGRAVCLRLPKRTRLTLRHLHGNDQAAVGWDVKAFDRGNSRPQTLFIR